MKIGLSEMIPRDIVTELDKYIIGQEKAKKAVAIALRNRIRRSKLADDIRDEVAPRNIIMIGPTGVGKTEIARRLAKLAGAPFIKVEATKFTEVGYVGRDVESMVRDLMTSAISMVKSDMKGDVEPAAREAAEEELLDLLLPGSGKRKGEVRRNAAMNKSGGFPGIQIGAITLGPNGIQSAGTTPPIGFNQEEEEPKEELPPPEDEEKKARKERMRESFREKLRAGELEDRLIEVSISRQSGGSFNMFAGGGGMESMDINMDALSSLFGGGGGKKKKKVTVKEARELLLAEHIDRMIDTDSAVDRARDLVQNMGIIFIDEMDKIANREGARGGQDVSREGVQRDILPIVEGSSVNTKYGMIDTSHILFIAAGAFNLAKPSDLIPELQGRFPLRVELEDLDADAFEQILTSPRNALTKQYAAIMKTEDVELVFTKEAVRRMAEIAAEVNKTAENIGARRLHTVMELLVEDISFDAADYAGTTVEITAEMVDEKLSGVVEDKDLSRYIL
ncbi:MAG: ATP-dependent protease ATPase subunit HslU [Spirochaetales bacterium]|nr:ATP-dependent protease ATPase subunit HslU [Spirochaetales bacterium]